MDAPASTLASSVSCRDRTPPGTQVGPEGGEGGATCRSVGVHESSGTLVSGGLEASNGRAGSFTGPLPWNESRVRGDRLIPIKKTPMLTTEEPMR